MIAVAVEEAGDEIGRIRMRRIADASAESLMHFIEDAVQLGRVVHTDGLRDYHPLKTRGYEHIVTRLRRHAGARLGVDAARPSCRRFAQTRVAGYASRRSEWRTSGCLPGRVHRRKSRSPGTLYYRLLEQAVAVEPIPYKALVKGPQAQYSETTRCRGHLSQVNTRLVRYR